MIRQFLEHQKEIPSFIESGPREYLYFEPQNVRIGIVTTGGIAPGLNTVIHSVVNMHWDIYGMRKEAIGFLGGFRGIAEERFIKLTPAVTKDWIHSGGTGLFAGRDKYPVPDLAARLEELGVDIVYIIGGDGSLSAAHQIAQDFGQREKKIAVVGIPKTMDNDVMWVWQSFGFNTAVEEATRIVNAIHDEAKSTQRVCLLPLFGRDAGFVAAHAALASGQVDVVLVPEIPFKIQKLLYYVQKMVQDKGYALVVLAEGASACEHSTKVVQDMLTRQGLNPDDRTNPSVNDALRSSRLYFVQQMFEEHFKAFRGGRHRVFVNEPRYLIRAVAANSYDQIYCQRLAHLAVHDALAGFTDFMVSQWLTEYVLVPLSAVTEGHKRIPPGGIFWTTVVSSTGQPSFE